MVAYTLLQRLNPTTALIGAGALGVVAALAAALIPNAMLESSVLGSGIAAFIPAAEPPLGFTARLCLGIIAGGGVALFAWFGLATLADFLGRPHRLDDRGPTVRRADAHPDAPPREPLRAGRDLGFELPEEDEALDSIEDDLPPEPVIARGAPAPTADPAPLDLIERPILRVRMERVDPQPTAAVVQPEPTPAAPPPVQPLPADLDQPLAAFDPSAVPDVPLATPRSVAPLHREAPRAPVFAEGERFEAFDLTPSPAVVAAAPITARETEATVHSLLDRLERGIARRTEDAAPEPAPATGGLETTLESLRKLAVRG